MVVDIFDRDSSVIDQNADGKAQGPPSHHVDGLAEPGQSGKREQDGERNLDEDDDGGAPAAKEYENHYADERRGERRFANDAEYRRLDENRLSRPRRAGSGSMADSLDARQQRFNSIYHLERRRPRPP